jgi:protein-disulfide isomerase
MKTIHITIICLAASFAIAILCNRVVEQRQSAMVESNFEVENTFRPITIHAAKTSRWRLIEYIDYDCPPCFQADSLISNTLNENPDLLTWDVVMFPLPIHKNAKSLAALMYLSAEKGFAREAHAELFESQRISMELRFNAISKLLDGKSTVRLKELAREKDREAEISFLNGKAIGVSGTPSIYLVSPDKMVFVVYNLNKLKSFIEGY